MRPLVTIVVPMYNVDNYIGKCIRSVFEQSYENIEYVFVDDCSPDNSMAVVEHEMKRYPDRAKNVKIIKHAENKGIAATRNTGLKNANGIYVLQVDGDDYIEKNTIQELLEKALAEEADIVVFDYYLEWKEREKEISHIYNDDKNEYLKLLLEGISEPAIWNKFIKKELFIKNDIEFFEGVNFGEDYLITPRVVYNARKIVKINKPFYHYIRWNVNSYSSNIKDKNIRDLAFVLSEHLNFFSHLSSVKNIEKSINIGVSTKILELLRDVRSTDQYKLIYQLFVNENEFCYNGKTIYGRIVLYLFQNHYFSLLACVQIINRYLRVGVQYVKGRM